MNNSNNISCRQLAKLLKKFHINDGDILVLKSKTGLANTQTVEDLANALGKMGLKNALVVVVDSFEDMSVLNETEMNKRGWFRFDSIAKMMKIPRKEAEQ